MSQDVSASNNSNMNTPNPNNSNSVRVFAFNYVLKNAAGEVLDASEKNQPLPFLEGKKQILPALETKIIQMQEGDKQKISLTATDAYGDYRTDMTMEVPKNELAHLNIEVGSHLQLQLQNQIKVVKVTQIKDKMVTLDGNHPLAGQELVFDVELVLIRKATSEEIQHGHAHGLHGHASHP